MTTRRFRQGVFTLSILFPAVVWALPFDRIVVLGDSLSDSDGNLMEAAGAAIPVSPAYAPGRFSNGLLWIDFLAAELGLPVENLAVSGSFAATIEGSNNFLDPFLPGAKLPGLADQVNTFIDRGGADPDALYVVWAGPNDFLAVPDPAIIGPTVTGLITAVGTLANVGAETIVVPNMPNLGITPFGLSTNGAGLTALSAEFNTALDAALLALEADLLAAGLGVNLLPFDVFGAQSAFFANPTLFGFTNVTEPCVVPATPPPEFSPTVLVQELNVCDNPDQYLSWDEVHPTERTHQLFSNAIRMALVPEPATIALFGAGLMATRMLRRRKRQGPSFRQA